MVDKDGVVAASRDSLDNSRTAVAWKERLPVDALSRPGLDEQEAYIGYGVYIGTRNAVLRHRLVVKHILDECTILVRACLDGFKKEDKVRKAASTAASAGSSISKLRTVGIEGVAANPQV